MKTDPWSPVSPVVDDSATTLVEVIAVAEEHSISPHGCMPNEWEPASIPAAPWTDEHSAQVALCRAFIQANRRSILAPSGWSRADSYSFKHRVERQSAGSIYIANGSFIIAALLEGAQLQRDGINAHFSRATKESA